MKTTPEFASLLILYIIAGRDIVFVVALVAAFIVALLLLLLLFFVLCLLLLHRVVADYCYDCFYIFVEKFESYYWYSTNSKK